MYKYIIYDIDGFLTESNYKYKSYNEAEKACIKEIDRIEKKCKNNFENSLITSYSIEFKAN